MTELSLFLTASSPLLKKRWRML